MPVRRAPIILRGLESAAIRAFRAEQREQLLERHAIFLGAAAPGSDARLRRALRAERRALASGRNYDPARHCALLRLLHARVYNQAARADV